MAGVAGSGTAAAGGAGGVTIELQYEDSPLKEVTECNGWARSFQLSYDAALDIVF
jgi:hypothetical protein